MRILHTMLPVTDLDRAIMFYVEAFGMRLRHRKAYDATFSNAYLDFGADDTSAIELARREGVSVLSSEAHGHVAFGVPNCVEACERVRALGGSVLRDAGASGATKRIYAFVRDPDGNVLELIEH